MFLLNAYIIFSQWFFFSFWSFHLLVISFISLAAESYRFCANLFLCVHKTFCLFLHSDILSPILACHPPSLPVLWLVTQHEWVFLCGSLQDLLNLLAFPTIWFFFFFWQPPLPLSFPCLATSVWVCACVCLSCHSNYQFSTIVSFDSAQLFSPSPHQRRDFLFFSQITTDVTPFNNIALDLLLIS